MTLGERIHKRRLELSMTQQGLADKAGYTSKITISKIEKSDRAMPQSRLLSLAEALQTTPTALMGLGQLPIT